MPAVPSSALLLPAALLALAAFAVMPALAAKADRSQPLVMEAERSGVMDGSRGTTVLNGNAVISQGSMLLRAERIEVSERADGYRAANAVGSKSKPATWRQKADGAADEFVEGSAERVEFDEKANTLRFAGNALLRRMRGSAVAQEINGNLIVWDNAAEVFKVEGGAATPGNPGGRVRVVLSPPADAVAAAAAASAGAASAPAASPLAPVRNLGERQ